MSLAVAGYQRGVSMIGYATLPSQGRGSGYLGSSFVKCAISGSLDSLPTLRTPKMTWVMWPISDSAVGNPGVMQPILDSPLIGPCDMTVHVANL